MLLCAATMKACSASPPHFDPTVPRNGFSPSCSPSLTSDRGSAQIKLQQQPEVALSHRPHLFQSNGVRPDLVLFYLFIYWLLNVSYTLAEGNAAVDLYGNSFQ